MNQSMQMDTSNTLNMSMASNLNMSNAMPRLIDFQITHAELVNETYAVSITTIRKSIFAYIFVF